MTQLFSNNASSTLDGAITSVATAIAVNAGDGALFESPTGGNVEKLTLKGLTGIEIIHLTARTVDTFTVLRAQEGTTALAFSDGDIIEARLTAGTLADLTTAAAAGFDANTDSIEIGTSARANATSAIAIGNDADVDAAGANYAIGLGYQCWVQGEHSVGLGYWSETASVASKSIAIGHTATTNQTGAIAIGQVSIGHSIDSIAFGRNAIAQSTSNYAIAIGADSSSYGVNSISIGYSASVFSGNTDSIAIGKSTNCQGSYAVSIGGGGGAYKDNSIKIGNGSVLSTYADGVGSIVLGSGAIANSDYAISIGYESKARITKTHNILCPSIVRKDNSETANTELLNYSGQENYVFSKEFDFTQTAADDLVSITIPSGASLYPNEIGVIVTSATTITVQPQFSFGITGSTAALLATTATTKSAVKGRDIFATMVTDDGQSTLTASLKVAATATAMLGRVYFKGLLVEDE